MDHLLKIYRAGTTPAGLLAEVQALANERRCAEYVLPGVEHGIGLWGDEWKVGAETNQSVPYWTDPTHTYQEHEIVVAALQYVCTEDDVGFRYENPVVLYKDRCEVMSQFPLAIEEIG